MNSIRSIGFRETEAGLQVRVHKSPKSSSAGKLKKRLPYNFKQMSKQIMQAKTSGSARPLIAKMQAKLSWLYKKLKSGEYGESEVAAAIIHAAAMERIAKRKVRHLEEEEAAENESAPTNAPGEEEEIFGKDELEESLEENEQISEEMMEQLEEEIEELEKELSEDMLSEIEDMISCAGKELSDEEIEELKRKHRNSEERQITRADMKYLKALFDRLEQEKRQNALGDFHAEAGDCGGFSCAVECTPEIEMVESAVGESLDISV